MTQILFVCNLFTSLISKWHFHLFTVNASLKSWLFDKSYKNANLTLSNQISYIAKGSLQWTANALIFFKLEVHVHQSRQLGNIQQSWCFKCEWTIEGIEIIQSGSKSKRLNDFFPKSIHSCLDHWHKLYIPILQCIFFEPIAHFNKKRDLWL